MYIEKEIHVWKNTLGFGKIKLLEIIQLSI